MPAYLLGMGTNKIKAVHVHKALGTVWGMKRMLCGAH